MHPHHRLALNKARSQFRKARTHLNYSLRVERNMREFMIVRDKTDHYHLSVLRHNMCETLRAIEDYQACGEILIAVERMLRNA